MSQFSLPESALEELPTLEYAYQMGYDYGRNGPSEINCYVTLFATPELHQAWNEGKADAAAGK